MKVEIKNTYRKDVKRYYDPEGKDTSISVIEDGDRLKIKDRRSSNDVDFLINSLNIPSDDLISHLVSDEIKLVLRAKSTMMEGEIDFILDSPFGRWHVNECRDIHVVLANMLRALGQYLIDRAEEIEET
jgi:hypothetical protein